MSTITINLQGIDKEATLGLDVDSMQVTLCFEISEENNNGGPSLVEYTQWSVHPNDIRHLSNMLALMSSTLANYSKDFNID